MLMRICVWVMYICRADQPEKALESYEIAAEKGIADALFNLGSIYYI